MSTPEFPPLLTLPATTAELLDQLDRLFPHRCPSVDQTDREIWLYAGQRALIDWMREQWRRTEAATGRPDTPLLEDN